MRLQRALLRAHPLAGVHWRPPGPAARVQPMGALGAGHSDVRCYVNGTHLSDEGLQQLRWVKQPFLKVVAVHSAAHAHALRRGRCPHAEVAGRYQLESWLESVGRRGLLAWPRAWRCDATARAHCTQPQHMCASTLCLAPPPCRLQIPQRTQRGPESALPLLRCLRRSNHAAIPCGACAQGQSHQQLSFSFSHSEADANRPAARPASMAQGPPHMAMVGSPSRFSPMLMAVDAGALDEEERLRGSGRDAAGMAAGGGGGRPSSSMRSSNSRSSRLRKSKSISGAAQFARSRKSSLLMYVATRLSCTQCACVCPRLPGIHTASLAAACPEMHGSQALHCRHGTNGRLRRVCACASALRPSGA